MSDPNSPVGHPALTDPETGLANRLHFDLVYHYLFHGADRGVPLTLMMMSVTPGEAETLAAAAARIRDRSRLTDLVTHSGGGRFILALQGTSLPGARVAADRIEMGLEGVASGLPAIGLAQYRPEMKTSGELLAAAESALSRARAAGGGVEMA